MGSLEGKGYYSGHSSTYYSLSLVSLAPIDFPSSHIIPVRVYFLGTRKGILFLGGCVQSSTGKPQWALEPSLKNSVRGNLKRCLSLLAHLSGVTAGFCHQPGLGGFQAECMAWAGSWKPKSSFLSRNLFHLVWSSRSQIFPPAASPSGTPNKTRLLLLQGFASPPLYLQPQNLQCFVHTDLSLLNYSHALWVAIIFIVLYFFVVVLYLLTNLWRFFFLFASMLRKSWHISSFPSQFKV